MIYSDVDRNHETCPCEIILSTPIFSSFYNNFAREIHYKAFVCADSDCRLNSLILLYCPIFCSRKIQFSLVILLVGVGIATVTDLQLNLLGSVLSLLAIVTTCVAQIVSFSL